MLVRQLTLCWLLIADCCPSIPEKERMCSLSIKSPGDSSHGFSLSVCQMDEVQAKAQEVLASLAEFFNDHPPELQWSRDAQLLASVQVTQHHMIVT